MVNKMDVMKKVPVREQDAKERATNFKEVCLGYNMEEAMAEASSLPLPLHHDERGGRRLWLEYPLRERQDCLR